MRQLYMPKILAIIVISTVACFGNAETREARKIAATYWGRTLNHCGSEWLDDSAVHRDVTFSTQAEPLTRSDELNAIEWKGYSVFRSQVARPFLSQTWVPNHNARVSISLLKKGGPWYYREYGAYYANWQPIASYSPRRQPRDCSAAAPIPLLNADAAIELAMNAVPAQGAPTLAFGNCNAWNIAARHPITGQQFDSAARLAQLTDILLTFGVRLRYEEQSGYFQLVQLSPPTEWAQYEVGTWSGGPLYRVPEILEHSLTGPEQTSPATAKAKLVVTYSGCTPPCKLARRLRAEEWEGWESKPDRHDSYGLVFCARRSETAGTLSRSIPVSYRFDLDEGWQVAGTGEAQPTSYALEVPELPGSRVVDKANLLSDVAQSQLASRLNALERITGVQMAALTIRSLRGEDLEDYTLRVAETWGLRRGGILVLVAREDRLMRLEVGVVLQPLLTNEQSRQIVEEILGPSFRSGDFAGGLETAVDTISSTLQSQGVMRASPP